MPRSISQRLLSVAVALGLLAPPFHATAFASASAEADVVALTLAPRGKKAAAAPATDGKTIGLMRFSGDPKSNQLREDVKATLEANGFSVKSVALDMGAASAKVKCKAGPMSDQCAESVSKWLNASPKTAADLLVFGSVDPGPSKQAEVVVFDAKAGKPIKRWTASLATEDLVVPIVLPQAVARGVKEHFDPPAEATEDEKKIIAELDEPDKTPEEIQAEKDELAKVEDDATKVGMGQAAKVKDVPVDLKADFKDFCREGARAKRKTRDDPKDLRPKCKRGPFWGYWQPRAWVALGLTSGLALGTIAFYSLALVARSPYKKSVDDLDAYTATLQDDPTRVPPPDGTYTELATEVSRTGSIMRRRAIVGDVLLGATVLVGAVLGIIIYQDRRDAKQFLKEEKGLRQAEQVSDVRVGPIITKETKGMGLSFRF
jgi:hypothetical protein